MPCHPLDDALRTSEAPQKPAFLAGVERLWLGLFTSQNENAGLEHYHRALALNPRHRGAHEYIGEAYLMLNDLAKAEEHLASLKGICLIPCEEYADLDKAIAAYRERTGK